CLRRERRRCRTRRAALGAHARALPRRPRAAQLAGRMERHAARRTDEAAAPRANHRRRRTAGRMKRRFIALWVPHFAIDRWRRANGKTGTPFALAAPQAHGVRLAAVDDGARALGLAPGRPVAEAHAMVPQLRIERADAGADQAMLAQLVAWCGRWSPSV